MRILHSMFRVADLGAALEFYTRVLDIRLLRHRDYPDGRFTLAFVDYQDECAAAALELTYNQDRDGYTQGDGYGRLAIEVGGAAVTCARARALGYWVTREAEPMQHGCSTIAFLEDPDSYKMELIQEGIQLDRTRDQGATQRLLPFRLSRWRRVRRERPLFLAPHTH